MGDNLRHQLSLLPEYLGAHITVATSALLVGVTASLPLGIVAARSRASSAIVLAVAGVVQTIPGLALLALMVPLLSAFGFWPTLCALVLYSMLPVLRNTVTALTTLDPAVLEAARGVGMTHGQVLRQVELPLALPMIVAGIRTAAVWVVGMATLSTPVGQPSLGNYIFSGLQTRNWTAVLVGCVAAAALALAIDGLLAVVERGLSQRRRSLSLAAAFGLALLLVTGSAGSRWFRSWTEADVNHAQRRVNGALDATKPAVGADEKNESHSQSVTPRELERPLRIGAKTFTEQYILARLLERRARAAGFDTQRLDSLGSTVAFDALRSGELDVYVDYTGTIYANYMKRSRTAAAWEVEAATASWLAEEHGVRQLGRLGFENAYALAVRRDTAKTLTASSIAGLKPVASALKLGGDYEFFQRPEWERLRKSYDLNFAQLVSFDSTFMYDALRDGEVGAISAFSSDGRIAAYDLVVLDDPLSALPPYDAVLLLTPELASHAGIEAAFKPLLNAISVEEMRRANWMVDRTDDKRSIEEAAIWLETRL